MSATRSPLRRMSHAPRVRELKRLELPLVLRKCSRTPRACVN